MGPDRVIAFLDAWRRLSGGPKLPGYFKDADLHLR